MTTWIWVWLAIIVVCVIVEACTMELLSCWCIFGGLVALILAICNVEVVWQWIAFGVVSVALLLVFRRLALKFLIKKDELTNADAQFGKTAELITPVKKNENGTIKLHGIVWSVATDDHSELEAGTTVKLVSLQGNKYIVKKYEEDKEDNK